MTREEIKNTPEVVERLLDKCVLVDSRAKLRKRLEEVCDMAIKALEQEPKMGHWIIKSHGFPPEPASVCSECGFDRDFNIRTIGFKKIKYCPNCGIKIVELVAESEVKYADSN